jgi:hypothetical protein
MTDCGAAIICNAISHLHNIEILHNHRGHLHEELRDWQTTAGKLTGNWGLGVLLSPLTNAEPNYVALSFTKHKRYIITLAIKQQDTKISVAIKFLQARKVVSDAITVLLVANADLLMWKPLTVPVRIKIRNQEHGKPNTVWLYIIRFGFRTQTNMNQN